jgi:hypothetical protein
MKKPEFEHSNNATIEERDKFEERFEQYLSFTGKKTDNSVYVSINRKGALRAVYLVTA